MSHRLEPGAFDAVLFDAGGILVRGREHRHGGPIEIGGPPTLPLEVIP